MSCTRCSSPGTPTPKEDGIGVLEDSRSAITENVQYLLKTFRDHKGRVPDPSLYMNKLEETAQVVETTLVQLPPCEEAIMKLLTFLRNGPHQYGAPMGNGQQPCYGDSPIVDREEPPSVRLTIEQEDWERIDKQASSSIKTMLHELKSPWNEIAQVSKHRLHNFNILELCFENEEKKAAVLNAAEKRNGLQALKSRLQLQSSVTVHQDIYQVKVFDVRFGRKMYREQLMERVSAWSRENEVSIERAHYARNELRLELTSRADAIKLVDQHFIVIDGRKYTDLRPWDRRWDRFQCRWCLRENHSAAWCRQRGTKPNCLWCAGNHPPEHCGSWGIEAMKRCINCGENHCGTDNKCKHPTVVAELDKRRKMQNRGMPWYRNRRVIDQDGFTMVGGRGRGRGRGRGQAATTTTTKKQLDGTARTQAATANSPKQQPIFQFTVPWPTSQHDKRAGTTKSARASRKPGAQPSPPQQQPAVVTRICGNTASTVSHSFMPRVYTVDMLTG